jgi:hypothetical protein
VTIELSNEEQYPTVFSLPVEDISPEIFAAASSSFNMVATNILNPTKVVDTESSTIICDVRLSLPRLSGLVIGDQKSNVELLTERKTAQSAYKNQLSEDIEKKSLTRICSVHRKSMSNVQIHDDSNLCGLNVGKDIDVLKLEKRSAARILLTQTLIDIGNS